MNNENTITTDLDENSSKRIVEDENPDISSQLVHSEPTLPLITMAETLISQKLFFQSEADFKHQPQSTQPTSIVYHNNIQNVQISNVVMNSNSTNSMGNVNLSNQQMSSSNVSNVVQDGQQKQQSHSPLFGSPIRLKSKLLSVTVSWKKGSFFGFGGDRNEHYHVMIYTLNSTGAEIKIFVHESMELQESTVIDFRFQNGIIFLVLHDKLKCTPYQHRFIENTHLEATNRTIKKIDAALDLSWAVGEYLHNF